VQFSFSSLAKAKETTIASAVNYFCLYFKFVIVTKSQHKPTSLLSLYTKNKCISISHGGQKRPLLKRTVLKNQLTVFSAVYVRCSYWQFSMSTPEEYFYSNVRISIYTHVTFAKSFRELWKLNGKLARFSSVPSCTTKMINSKRCEECPEKITGTFPKSTVF